MASNIAAKCSARSAISQAENFAPVITACLTPGGSNTSLGNTEHARKPPDVSRCLTKENQSRFNAAANVKLEQRETATYDVPDLSKCHKEETIPPCSLEAKNKSDETSQNAFEENGTSQSGKRYDILNEISKAFQDIPLSGNDRFLYDDVMETATREINRFLHYGQLRVRLESRRDPVLIEFGDGKDEISCYFKNGVTNWIATKPAIIKYTSKNSFLESNDVENATGHLFLSEQEIKLIHDAVEAVSNRNQTKQIKNAVLTISFKTGDRVEIHHGKSSLKMRAMIVNGKVELRTENGRGIVQFLKDLYSIIPGIGRIITFLENLINFYLVCVRLYEVIVAIMHPPITGAAEGALAAVEENPATSS